MKNSLINYAEKYMKDIDVSAHERFLLREFALNAAREGFFESDLVGKRIIPYEYKDSNVKLNVRCEGLMYGVSGFAEAMRNIAYNLDKHKINVSVNPLDTEYADDMDTKETPKGKVIHDLSQIGYEGKWPKVRIVMTIPEGIHRVGDYYMIGYIMFETQEFPKKYIKHLEKNVDELWVPSQFNVDNILAAGWKKPIFRMPLGVDIKRFNPKAVLPFEAWESPIGAFKDKFVFLSIMGWSERKGVSRLIEAYLREFDYEENVILYIKGGWYDIDKAKREVKSVVNKVGHKTYPPIFLDFNIYPEKDHSRLYKTANAFVLPTLGEGWGLNFTEAMSMELPTIGTHSTSMVDFMNVQNSFPVGIEWFDKDERCDWICPEYKGANFAIPNIESLREQMRFVYNERGSNLNPEGKQARKDMIDKYTWDHAAKNWIDRLKQIQVTFKIERLRNEN